MIRAAIGGILGGCVIFLIGFIFWGTPLSGIAFNGVDEQTSAEVQAALARGLTETGTGVYNIPSPDTSAGTTLYGRGPVAQVFYNVSGFPVVDSGAMIGGFILSLVVGVMIALAILALSGSSTTFANRAKGVVLMSGAATLWLHIGQGVFNHAPWRYILYLGFSDFVALTVAGLLIARWFMPSETPHQPSA